MTVLVRRRASPAISAPASNPQGASSGAVTGTSELRRKLWGDTTDGLTGTAAGYATDWRGGAQLDVPFAAHDKSGGAVGTSRLRGYSAGMEDWSDGATIQHTETGGLSGWTCLDVWDHVWPYGPENRFDADLFEADIYGTTDGTTWNLLARPNAGDSSLWCQWYVPGFSPLASGSYTQMQTPGGSLFWRFDMSQAYTATNNAFLHTAPEAWWPRLQAAGYLGLCVQQFMRLHPHTGVDLSTCHALGGTSSDTLPTTTSSGADGNEALGIPAYVDIPNVLDPSTGCGQPRLMGYVWGRTEAQFDANPPPVKATPT